MLTQNWKKLYLIVSGEHEGWGGQWMDERERMRQELAEAGEGADQ